MENKYYLYYHFNPITRKLFYVGVGYKNRAYAFKWGRSKHYYNYLKKYGDPIVIIRYKNLEEDYAYLLEEKLIAKFGRIGIDEFGILVNKSSGGKTSGSGVRQARTKEWNNNISKAKIGKPQHNDKGKKSISDKNSKPLIQFDLSGVILNEFLSIKEASIILNIPKSRIDTYLNSNRKILDGCIILKYKIPPTLRKGKIILEYDKEWNFIKEWDSINQAQKELKITGINNFLQGKNIKHKWSNKFKYKE